MYIYKLLSTPFEYRSRDGEKAGLSRKAKSAWEVRRGGGVGGGGGGNRGDDRSHWAIEILSGDYRYRLALSARTGHHVRDGDATCAQISDTSRLADDS